MSQTTANDDAPMPVHYERRGRVGLIIVNNPPVNVLSATVREGLWDAIERGVADVDAAALVIAGHGRTFIAGADITEFGQPLQGPDINDINARLEAATKPVVAAMHGSVLGGGLELALACHYRIAATGTMLGLPEVKLGLLPGGGGTQRLPRLVGARVAAEFITSGVSIMADDARKLGIVDELADEDLIGAAIVFAASLKPGSHPVVSARTCILTDDDRLDFEKLRRALGKSHRGQTAPLRCLAAVEAAFNLPFAQGLERERALFGECLDDPQSRALMRLFFAERSAARAVPATVKAKPLPARVGIIGSGTMGGGIAMSFANAGIPVTLLDISSSSLERGLKLVERNYASAVERGRLSPREMEDRMGRIVPTIDFAHLAEVDLVIEAALEDMSVKQKIFRDLCGVTKPGTILATNTSTLDIDVIASATDRPADVLGMHFFSPANVMRLLEIVKGAQTAPTVVATAMNVAKAIGKVGVVVGNCDGFVGNRMVGVYATAAYRLVEDGASPAQVDAALTSFGLAMGPFAMADMAGNDIAWLVRQRRLAEEKPAGTAMTDWLYEQGRLGLKAGKGWFTYAAGSRQPEPSAEVAEMIADHRRSLGITPRNVTDREIVDRCILALVNEGARILEEGIAAFAPDIDLIYVNGYGFPAWRGGPMGYAQERGLPEVLSRIRDFHARDGEEWIPAALLTGLVDRGATEWDATQPRGQR